MSFAKFNVRSDQSEVMNSHQIDNQSVINLYIPGQESHDNSRFCRIYPQVQAIFDKFVFDHRCIRSEC